MSHPPGIWPWIPWIWPWMTDGWIPCRPGRPDITRRLGAFTAPRQITRTSPCYSVLIGFYSVLMGFYSVLIRLYSVLIGFYIFFMGCDSVLMGFYSVLMGYEWDVLSGNLLHVYWKYGPIESSWIFPALKWWFSTALWQITRGHTVVQTIIVLFFTISTSMVVCLLNMFCRCYAYYSVFHIFMAWFKYITLW